MHFDFSSAQVTVMGLGRFGGGAGIARWLVEQGASVLITDMQSEDELSDALQVIDDLRPHIQLQLGGHDERDFTSAGLVIANPAVSKPWENRYLLAARGFGVPITTEIRLLVERLNRDRVIGVTGSAGKSTTTAMIHHILTSSGRRSHLGGNIGGSLLSSLNTIKPDDWIVLELSSFMLHWLGSNMGWPDMSPWSPHVAILTNIEPNHLDWHGTFEHYEQCKQNIFRYQQRDDIALTMNDVQVKPVELRIPGAHNQLNANMAIEVAEQAAGIAREAAASALSDFPGLPHRLALVTERDGLRFYNDSKSTTPAATLLAVASFDDPSTVHLIAGGYDKGSDLSAISDLTPQLGGLYGIGATGENIVRQAPRVDGPRKAIYCGRLEVAVLRAINDMRRGDVLLLSPGCASWDQFTNFQRRGDAFAAIVQEAIDARGVEPA